MSNKLYEEKKEEVSIGKAEKIIDTIFKDASVKHGLKEFQGINVTEEIKIFEKEIDKYYVHCLKRDRDILIHSASKNAPEEIIRQLWLKKLNMVIHGKELKLKNLSNLDEKFEKKQLTLSFIKRTKLLHT